MIANNALEKRLNAVMKGQKPIISELPYEFNDIEKIENILEFIPEENNILKNIWKSIDVILASILYGYAFSGLLNLEWRFLEIAGLGFMFNYSISILPKKLFHFFKLLKNR